MAAEVAHGDQRLWGVGVFVAIVLHKPLDALSVTTLMQAAGWSLLPRQIANFLVTLMCPLGAVVAWQIGRQPAQSPLLGAVLGFAAGAFVCISLSDLLPELQFHRHDGAILSVALLGGIALALLIGWLEPAHLHQHPQPTHPEHPRGESQPGVEREAAGEGAAGRPADQSLAGALPSGSTWLEGEGFGRLRLVPCGNSFYTTPVYAFPGDDPAR
jgi:zinc and cadmium transporter